MPQISINTSNIVGFGYSASLDVFNRTLTFNILPFTTGAGLSNTKVAFSIVDQDGVTLATINWAAPQIPNPGTTTTWVLDLSSVNFAFLFQAYAITGAIQDQNGTVYTIPTIYTTICQPSNLTDTGYVPGLFQILPDCINSVITVKEITQLVYNGLQPQSITKTGNLYYPVGTISAVPFSNTPFSNNVVYTGQYSIQCTTVAVYSMPNDVYIRVSYITNNVFPVICANKMSDVVCCITKLQQTAIKNCNNAIGENAKQQLADISLYVMNGMLKEMSGQDSQFEVDYIRKYLSCDCGSASLSQTEFTPINPAVTSIVLTGGGGTTVPAPTTTGNTKTYAISSNVYQVTKGNTGDLAFTITADTTVSNTVKYVITFNYDTMAGYILTAIGADPTLLAQLNALVQATGVNLQGLNGGCVIDLTKTNYSLSQAITGSTLVASIFINGNSIAAPANLFANNPTAVAAWLNTLTLGAFSASVASGILTILSVNNTNTVSTLTFTSPNVTQQFQATNATLVQVLQAIINYLCSLTDLQIALSSQLALCTLDYNNNVVTTPYVAGTKQSAYNAAVAGAICNIVARINTLTGLTCAKIQALFISNPGVSFSNATDWFMSSVAGGCTQLTGQQAAMAVIAAINTYPTVKAAFCAISCTTPATCPDVASINLNTVSGNIALYGVSWGVTPTASQTATVRYRLNGSSIWTISTNALQLFPNGNINGTSPYIISGASTPGSTYQIWVQNNCGGAGFIQTITVPTSTLFSGMFLLDNVIYNICGDSPTTLYSSASFATGVTMYQDAGLTTPVTGFTFIANASTGEIFQISSVTGLVGSDTGNSCSSGEIGVYILGNNSGTICSGVSTNLYTNGAFATGGTLYQDSALSTPQTGFAYVVSAESGGIYNLNPVTGVIGTYTGTNCGSIPNSVMLAATSNSICVAAPSTVYTSGPITTGTVLYFDAGLTTAVTGYLVVVYSNNLYSLNSTTGVVGGLTSQTCSDTIINNGSSWATVTGINLLGGFVLSGVIAPGGTQNGTHGAFTNTIQVTVSGSITGSTKQMLLKNGVLVSCKAITGAGTVTFDNVSFLTGDSIVIRLGGGTC